MEKKISFIVPLFAVFISITGVSKSSIKFQDFLDIPRNTPLTLNSPEDRLRKSYKEMRKNLLPNTFEGKIADFEGEIFYPISMGNIVNQNSYIDEVMSLKTKLNNVDFFFKPYFKTHVAMLDNRLDSARIDQQLFTGDSHRGDFNYLHIPLNYQNPLNILVGKIFLITQTKNLVEDVVYSGSGMFMSLNVNNIQNLDNNQNYALNSVLTCPHVLEAQKKQEGQESEHITGAYFIPNNSLNPDTGFPLDLINPVNNKNDLINFLRTNNNSFQISTYKFKRRDNIFNGNFTNNYDLTTTSSQYWENEDIAIGNIALKLNQNFRTYQNNIVINFDTIANNQALNFNNNERYSAIGYPTCDHYDLLPFENTNYNNPLLLVNPHPQLALINSMGLSPLIITSSTSHDIGFPNAKPSFANGVVKQEAPTSKGMSGGLLVRILNNQIDIFSSIAGKSDTDEYEGCY